MVSVSLVFGHPSRVPFLVSIRYTIYRPLNLSIHLALAYTRLIHVLTLPCTTQGLIATTFWMLLGNGIVATQVVEDGTMSSLVVRSTSYYPA